MPTSVIVIRLNPSLQCLGRQRLPPLRKKRQKKQHQQQQQQQQLSHPPPSHAVIEDIIRQIIAQMTSTSKTYIPCLLATIIK